MKHATGCLYLAALVFVSLRAGAQDIPAYTPAPATPGFQLPQIGGTLRYSLSGSESIALGYDGNNETYESTNISGNLAYLSRSAIHPFSLIYSGGYLFATSGQHSSFFQNLAASQVFVVGRWSGVVSDSVSYLPSTPVGGLSGVPGVGDVGIPPVQVTQNDGSGLLSNYGTRISNNVSGSLSRNLTNRTSLFGSGTMSILEFPGSASAGLNTHSESGSGGISHTFTARTSLNGSYSYYRSSYPEYSLAYVTQSGIISVSYRWSQRLTSSLSAGPQYSSTQYSGGTLNYSLGGNLNYQIYGGGLSANFFRGVSNGQGVTATALSDNASGSFSHRLGEFSSYSTNISYNHISTLPISLGPQFTTNSLAASFQLSRSITRTISAYASYTAQHQLLNQSAYAVNALNGTTQTLGFGVTYSPLRPITIGHN